MRLIGVRLSFFFFKRKSSNINRNRYGLNLKVKCGTGLCSCSFMTLPCGPDAWGSDQCLRQGWSPFSFTWPLPDQGTRTKYLCLRYRTDFFLHTVEKYIYVKYLMVIIVTEDIWWCIYFYFAMEVWKGKNFSSLFRNSQFYLLFYKRIC